jgi:hypothetical protein
MALPTSVQGAAVVVGMMRLGQLAVQAITAYGVHSTQARAATSAFQQAWNLSIPTLRVGGLTAAQTPQLATDGLYGRNTAAALTAAITNGTAPLPQTSAELGTWYATNAAGVEQYISGVMAQAQAAVVAGSGNAQDAAAVASGAQQVMQQANDAANQVVQQANSNSGSANLQPPHVLGGDVTFPITGAPPKTNTFMIVMIGLGLVATATIIGWAAWRKKKRARKP